MGPHIGPETAKDLDRILDRRNGPEYLIRRIMYPSVPEAYAETMAAAVQGCDLIVTHPITFGSQIAAGEVEAALGFDRHRAAFVLLALRSRR